jgi:hypothetical protein
MLPPYSLKLKKTNARNVQSEKDKRLYAGVETLKFSYNGIIILRNR